MSHPNNFRNNLAESVFQLKYAQGSSDTWHNLAQRLVDHVCGGTDPLMSQSDRDQLVQYIYERKIMPGGRYLYYAGRDAAFFNNCYLLKAEEDTREEWGALAERASSCLMTGGGIGVDYSRLRASGAALKRTGGVASGPLPLMHSINEIGRSVMQGGSRRSAIYASLDASHGDAGDFLKVKNWDEYPVGDTGKTLADIKSADFNFPCPLDHTNISLNYSDSWLESEDRHLDPIFVANVRQAMMTGEPGFSFNFGAQADETLRNACCEVTSRDDSDVCNLASVNLAEVGDLEEMADVVTLAQQFLLCGTLRADLPYQKVHDVRALNRRLGLGLMGIHEWLLKRGIDYSVNPELRSWLSVYRDESTKAGNEMADFVGVSRPVAHRAIAPTGSISILAGTTSGIEPVIYSAYKRRYLTGSSTWKHQFVIDATTRHLVEEIGINPANIETSSTLASYPEKRIRFQASVQAYVDMAISSTLNLPQWGSELNNDDRVEQFARIISEYAPRLRGLTCYPDGSRGGQPIVEVPYSEALGNENVEYLEHDICDITGGGTCAS